MCNISKQSRLARFTHQILNALATTDLVVNENFLRFSVCDGDSMTESQFDRELKRLIDAGLVKAKGTICRITPKGVLVKQVMNRLRDK